MSISFVSDFSEASLRMRLKEFRQSQSYDYAALIHHVNRHRRALACWILGCLGIAGLYLLFAQPQYTAYTQVVLEPPRVQRAALDTDGEPTPLDSAQADSRIQVIKSERVLRYVFETLKLDQKSEPDTGWLGRKGPVSKTEALVDFMERVSARRIGQSYVIEISFRDGSPDRAARMANSVTSAYLRDLVLAAPKDGVVLKRRVDNVAEDAVRLSAAVEAGQIPNGPILGIDTRVISAAIEPLGKTSPHKMLTLLLAFCLGTTSAVALLIVRQTRDRTFRTPRQAQSIFGAELLAVDDGEPRGNEHLLAALPLNERGMTSVAVASWQNSEATRAVANMVGGLLAETGYVTILTQKSHTRSVTSRTAARMQAADHSEKTEIPPNHSVCHEHKDFRRSSVAKNEELIGELTSLRSRGHLVLALPDIKQSAAAMALAPTNEGIMLVLEGGASSYDDAVAALEYLGHAKVRCLGIVLHLPNRKAQRSSSPVRRFFRQALKAMQVFARAKEPSLPCAEQGTVAEMS